MLGKATIATHRLCTELKKDISIVSDCFIGASDFIRIVLKDEYIQSRLESMLSDERLGIPIMNNECVVVDYFGPNVGKELHLGHLRSLAMGQMVSNVLEFYGATVHRRNHVGDFGSQSGVIIRYLLEYDPKTLESLDYGTCNTSINMEKERMVRGHKYPEEVIDTTDRRLGLGGIDFPDQLTISTLGEYYRISTLKYKDDDLFAHRARLETTALQNGKSVAQKQWDNVVKISLRHFTEILKSFNATKLKHIPESCYKIRANQLIDSLLEAGVAKQFGDSYVEVFLSDCKDSGANRSVLRTRDGALTYMATDLAALRHRISTHKPDIIIYITDEAQEFHFKRLEEIAIKANILGDCKIEHMGYSPILSQEGDKIRSRSGTQYRISETLSQIKKLARDMIVQNGDYISQTTHVLSERIGAGGILFSELSTHHEKSDKYSIDRIAATGLNPLFSLLLSYSSAFSILNRLLHSRTPPEYIKDDGFRNETERSLALTLMGLENEVYYSLKSRISHRLCKYLRTVSERFELFCKETTIVDGNKVHLGSLNLVKLTYRVMKLVFSLLGIKPVEKF
ncbi:arginyl-tRNA synthetase, putative [Theileria equi strain WA]|uniref:arginine--tRNA ligase n=1 Tax=Theileria equi strain WA TaxID=1537102 RepID=L1LGC2_THEEQ|nr:arginyl-tRNA synthetase, putative [Theileria equi strain WA]EKX74198.1 arginyl-tRNA synthetase, putative [Theileria equi strain WA]|eukprot:XP_004833650.1 arginyl-tRNA synthetase, putative [Theileria equi strain WA]